MEDIIKKRTDLINYFKNENQYYSKKDVLAKEFSALSFSIREEYIDNIKTPYDNLLTDFDDIEDDTEELYVKGIIIDVDNKKGYTILHIQNKDVNQSVSCSEVLVHRYGKYFETGHVIIINCHSYSGRLYMHFMIDCSVDDSFVLETNYINGIAEETITEANPYEYDNNVALVKQATYFTSKKGTKCLRLSLRTPENIKNYITCQNAYNDIPRDIMTGMFVEYQTSDSETFINNVRQIRI